MELLSQFRDAREIINKLFSNLSIDVHHCHLVLGGHGQWKMSLSLSQRVSSVSEDQLEFVPSVIFRGRMRISGTPNQSMKKSIQSLKNQGDG